jgi:hypothetical protein
VTCHTAHMARVRCKVGIKCLSCTEKQEGPTLVARKCGHEFYISLRSKVRRHRDTKRQSGLLNLLLALSVLTTSAYSNLGVLQGFEPPTSARYQQHQSITQPHQLERRVDLLLKESSYMSNIILHRSIILELKLYKLHVLICIMFSSLVKRALLYKLFCVSLSCIV